MQCRIREGGGLHFGDDLWTCAVCGQEKYPEVFSCPRGEPDPRPTQEADERSHHPD